MIQVYRVNKLLDSANIITRGLEAYTGDLEETSKAFVSMVAAANEFLVCKKASRRVLHLSFILFCEQEILKALCAELDRCYQRRVGESDAHTKELEQFYEGMCAPQSHSQQRLTTSY